MDQLFRKTKSNIDDLTLKLTNLEKSIDEDDFNRLKLILHAQFQEIHLNLDRLEINLNKESQLTRKSELKLRIDQLKYDYKHLHTAAHTIEHKKEQLFMQERQRNELLSSIKLENSTIDTRLLLDNDLNEISQQSRLRSTNKALDDMIQNANLIYDNLLVQNDKLKSTKKRIADIFNSLGLSNTIIQLINRRSNVDKKIVFILMILTCLIMFLTIKYLI